MIKAKHHMVIYPLFKWLTMFLIRRHFHNIVLKGEYTVKEKPLIIIANHVSWWDGFWIMYLNLKLLHKRFHFMMLEVQLRKHWYFQYSGAYSVQRRSRSIIESLDYTVELLKDSKNMVFVFPQGMISSMYNDHIKFERGVERIIKQAPDNLDVLFVANFVDFFSEPKPSLFMYISSYSAGNMNEISIESAYTAFYMEALNSQKVKTS